MTYEYMELRALCQYYCFSFPATISTPRPPDQKQ